MKINYKFINNEISEVEVDTDFVEIIQNLDRKIRNNDRCETRRHISYNVKQCKNGKEFDIPDPRINVEKDYIDKEKFIKLQEFIKTLSPPQQRLLKMLEYGMTIKEISRKTDSGISAVYNMRNRLQKNIKEFLKNLV